MEYFALRKTAQWHSGINVIRIHVQQVRIAVQSCQSDQHPLPAHSVTEW